MKLNATAYQTVLVYARSGKVASARWWCQNVLPTVALTRKYVEESSLDLMQLDDSAF